LSSGEEDGGVGGTPLCLSSGNGDNGRGRGPGGGRPGRRRRSCWRQLSVVVNDEINRLLDRRELGGEPPSSSLAVVGVAPLQQCGGIVWAEAAARNALEGCVLALEVGDVLLQALEVELLAQTPGCGCARAGGLAGPGTSAARRGGRRRGPPP